MSDWHGEPWAKHVSRLGQNDRTAIVDAARALLRYKGNLCDALESELEVLLECAADTDRTPQAHEPKVPRPAV